MKKIYNKNNGITLVALVVTIVVLIILAGISINLVLGKNGIITKAVEARNKTTETTLNEQIALNEIVEYINGIGGNKPTEPSKPNDWTSTEVTPIPDGEGGVIPLPNGFYYVGGNISTGIVISDNIKDKDKGTAYETVLVGNQFVWIPVKSEEDFKRTRFDSDGKPNNEYLTGRVEPYLDGYVSEVEEFNKMKEQVLKYKGFYIGRFEAGDGTNGTILRTEATTAHEVAIKKGIAPYNWIPWGKAANDISQIEGKSGAVYLSKKMYENSNSVVSTLCYGSQWDAMCRYIGDSGRTTPEIYPQPINLTGSESSDISKNIYDLAGSCTEWTMEAEESYKTRSTRGGGYIYSAPISNRGMNNTDGHSSAFGFRLTLYIR